MKQNMKMLLIEKVELLNTQDKPKSTKTGVKFTYNIKLKSFRWRWESALKSIVEKKV